MFDYNDFIRRIYDNINEGEDIGHKFTIDPETGNIFHDSPFNKDEDFVHISSEDLGMAHQMGENAIQIVVLEENIKSAFHSSDTQVSIRFSSQDNSTVFSSLLPNKSHKGLFIKTDDVQSIQIPSNGAVIQIYFSFYEINTRPKGFCVKDQCGWIWLRAFTKKHERFQECVIHIIPDQYNLFKRNHGILETDLISQNHVAIIGIGSFGSMVAVQLAQAGVGHFTLIDPERVEAGNVIRHFCGLDSVARYKTKSIKDRIYSINPYANVETREFEVVWPQYNTLKDYLSDSDLVIDLVDQQKPRCITNQICIELEKPCIRAGAMNRAMGGQVLRYKPGVTPCYQCFLSTINNNNSNLSKGFENRVAYSDRPVVPEPGLYNDILPITQMVTKLAIQELIQNTNSSLHSLNEDLTANWFIWLNRRETGTEFENLKPLQTEVNGMRIMRWYGVDFKRRTNCPACGTGTGLEETMAMETVESDFHVI